MQRKRAKRWATPRGRRPMASPVDVQRVPAPPRHWLARHELERERSDEALAKRVNEEA